jgi:hypothetical protein
MFRVEPAQGDQWRIIDEKDQVVFVGTVQQAEDWLDFHENAQRHAAPAGAWLRNFFDALRRVFENLSSARRSQPGSRPTASEFRRQTRKQ